MQDLEQQLSDFGDLAVIIDQLDLIISVDSPAAHLAGALGKKAWTLLNHIADWRWMLEGETTPWYPTMRLFRQTRPDDWTGVIDRVGQTLGTQMIHR
jgi:ADP-heptose:LPS heptosyltransferase